MCEVLDKVEARGIALGEARGIALGEARGIALGEARGIALGEIKGQLRLMQNLILDGTLTKEGAAHRLGCSVEEFDKKLAEFNLLAQ